MGTTQSSSEEKQSENPVVDVAMRILYTIRGSFSAFLVALGVVCVLLGLALQTGAMAGMLIIWGVSAILYAILLRIVLRVLTYSFR